MDNEFLNSAPDAEPSAADVTATPQSTPEDVGQNNADAQSNRNSNADNLLSIKQSDYGRKISEARREGEERARRQFEANQRSYAQNPPNNGQYAQTPQQQNVNAGAQESPEDIEQRVINKLQVNQRVQEIVGNIEAAKTKYPEDAEKIDRYTANLATRSVETANFLAAINSTKNPVEIMRKLSSDRKAHAELIALLEHDPQACWEELNSLSESISLNEAGKKQRRAEEPLSQLNPSTIGTDNGNESIESLRNKYRR